MGESLETELRVAIREHTTRTMQLSGFMFLTLWAVSLLSSADINPRLNETPYFRIALYVFALTASLRIISYVRDGKKLTSYVRDGKKFSQKTELDDEAIMRLDKAFEWFTVLTTVLIGVVLSYYMWLPIFKDNIVFVSNVVIAFIGPLVFGSFCWFWRYFMTESTQKMKYALFAWGCIGVVFLTNILLLMAMILTYLNVDAVSYVFFVSFFLKSLPWISAGLGAVVFGKKLTEIYGGIGHYFYFLGGIILSSAWVYFIFWLLI